jgi:hypothetical protein
MLSPQAVAQGFPAVVNLGGLNGGNVSCLDGVAASALSSAEMFAH